MHDINLVVSWTHVLLSAPSRNVGFTRVCLGINVFEINIERGGKKKFASVSTIMTGNVAHSRPESAAGDNEVISSLSTLYKISKVNILNENRGGSRIFFRRGCTRLLLYFNTNKQRSFLFCRIPVALENRRSSRGEGGGCTPLLHPPPRSAPGKAMIRREWYMNTPQQNFLSTDEPQ